MRLDANKQHDLIGWTPTDLLIGGDRPSNLLGVLCSGATFTVMLNGATVAQVTDATYQGRGEVGPISTGSSAEIVFRNLRLTPILLADASFDPKSTSASARAQAEVKRLASLDELRVRYIATSAELGQQQEQLAGYPDKIRAAQDSAVRSDDSAVTWDNQAQDYQNQMDRNNAAGLGLANIPLVAGQLLAQNEARKARDDAANSRAEAENLQREAQTTSHKVAQLRSQLDRMNSQASDLDRRRLFPSAPQPGTMIPSQLGNWGLCFALGVTPVLLGWGGDDMAYPDRFVVNYADGAEMSWVPAGPFQMGVADADVPRLVADMKPFNAAAGPGTFADDQPAHRVELSQGFWMYRTEVTAGQFRLVKSDHTDGAFTSPVTSVTWAQAVEYATTVGGALPTEAQWECACRAGEAAPYWWGIEDGAAAGRANIRLNPADVAPPVTTVASLRPNGLGLYDMAGNVAEWCADWHDASYYGASPSMDPPGPTRGTRRVVRGGASSDCVAYGASSSRLLADPSGTYPVIGFRVCAIP